ncbi:hypothetical protein [Streptosporangium roseum]|uniref:hypothetical protein n=1 Tax=Streptosporangium roseum TaxID=2001 RepID=UPI0012DEF405|nr:hypothetical protein [Streptosporangium roseum]
MDLLDQVDLADVGDETLAPLPKARDGQAEVRPCSTGRQPDAPITAPPQVLVALFTGMMSLRTAKARGLVVDGSTAALERLLSPG